MNKLISLTNLAQVRQRRASALLFPLKNAHIERHTLLIKRRAKYGMSYKGTVTIGTALVAALGERNKNMDASLKAAKRWRQKELSRLSQSLAKVEV